MPAPSLDQSDSARPVTLHQVMQDALGGKLRTHYPTGKDIPHALLVLVMQIPDPAQREQELSAASKASRFATAQRNAAFSKFSRSFKAEKSHTRSRIYS